MNQVKNRIAALALLDRAFRQLTDDTIVALRSGLDDEKRDAFDRVAGTKDSADGEVAAAVREVAVKGRLNGNLERMSVLLTDSCLAECIETLGNAADDPSEGQLRDVLPGLIDKHGLATVQVMMASAVTGEAEASEILVRILKHDDAWKLPPVEVVTTAPVVMEKADDPERAALREQRKARRAAEQEAARARREQSQKARRR